MKCTLNFNIFYQERKKNKHQTKADYYFLNKLVALPMTGFG